MGLLFADVGPPGSPDWQPIGCHPVTEYDATGANQSFVVPAGITSLTFDLYGAEGGLALYNGAFVSGGLGGRMRVTVAVTPGETLTLKVGGQPTGTSGGWPDGGAVYSSANGSRGGSGGGSTSLWRGGTLLAIVGAGGGAGGGEGDALESGGHGGDGGSATGQAGTAGNTAGTTPGGGATSAAGGAAGTNGTGSTGPVPTAGASLAGGHGGRYDGWYNGGGGGGGYFGGGGGGSASDGFRSGPNGGPPYFFPLTTASGGGGGSSHSSETVLLNERGVHAGDGRIDVLLFDPGLLVLELPDGSFIREACDDDVIDRHPVQVEDPDAPGTWVTAFCAVPV